ncbi:hypothetical protein CLU79DRAFT_861869 [Phycomyces nitens]|nr:hypothetical protein CLU79DRAFT_861869 [Phycomyces nitens]
MVNWKRYDCTKAVTSRDDFIHHEFEKLDVTNHVKYDCTIGTEVDDVDLDDSICYGCDQYFPSCDLVSHRQTHPGFVDALAGTWRLPFAGTKLSTLNDTIGLVGWDCATITQHLRQKRIWKHPNIISLFLQKSGSSPLPLIPSLVGENRFSALSTALDTGDDCESDVDDTPLDAFDTPIGVLDATANSNIDSHNDDNDSSGFTTPLATSPDLPPQPSPFSCWANVH